MECKICINLNNLISKIIPLHPLHYPGSTDTLGDIPTVDTVIELLSESTKDLIKD